MKSAWVRLALVCLAATAAAVAVGGGSAGNRVAEATFAAFPGPGRVTYAENIAYRATFTNTGGSNFTKVTFRQSVPVANGQAAQLVNHSCPSAPTIVDGEFRCAYGSLAPGTAGTPQLVITVIWKVPTLALPDGCDCLATTGRWTIKEGVNDPADPNDAFGRTDIVSTLLATRDRRRARGRRLRAACHLRPARRGQPADVPDREPRQQGLDDGLSAGELPGERHGQGARDDHRREQPGRREPGGPSGSRPSGRVHRRHRHQLRRTRARTRPSSSRSRIR